MAGHAGEDGHQEEGGEGGGEDLKARMPHRHQGSDDECFVANFGGGDGGKGTKERVPSYEIMDTFAGLVRSVIIGVVFGRFLIGGFEDGIDGVFAL